MLGTHKSQVTGLNGWDLFIDPGHSQDENMGINGYSEAKEVLQVGLKQNIVHGKGEVVQQKAFMEVWLMKVLGKEIKIFSTWDMLICL